MLRGPIPLQHETAAIDGCAFRVSESRAQRFRQCTGLKQWLVIQKQPVVSSPATTAENEVEPFKESVVFRLAVVSVTISTSDTGSSNLPKDRSRVFETRIRDCCSLIEPLESSALPQ